MRGILGMLVVWLPLFIVVKLIERHQKRRQRRYIGCWMHDIR